MDSIFTGIYFLIRTVFFILTLMLMIRFLAPIFKVNQANPLMQSILSITQGFTAAARSIIPNYQNIEIATLLVIWVVTMIKVVLLKIFSFSGVNLLFIPFIAIFDAARVALDVFLFSIIVVAIYSFIPSPQLGQLAEVANRFADPILNPIRQYLPKVGAIDFSPLVAFVLIKLIDLVVLMPFV